MHTVRGQVQATILDVVVTWKGWGGGGRQRAASESGMLFEGLLFQC
jgi:hypothetical protein